MMARGNSSSNNNKPNVQCNSKSQRRRSSSAGARMMIMRRIVMALAVLLLLAAVAAIGMVSAAVTYRPGDSVSMLKRSQYKGFRTPWSTMQPHGAQPHFAVTNTVQMQPIGESAVLQYEGDEPFKIAFSFADDRFLTSWLTVTDGSALFLSVVQFDFTYAGSLLLGVKWRVEYHDMVAGRPEHIALRYVWHKHVEKDTDLGLNLLVILAAIVSWGLAVWVLATADYSSSSSSSNSSSNEGKQS
jgi:hypothetical protein